MKAKLDIKKLTGIGLLSAIVFVLQLLSLAIRFGQFTLCFVIVPIVIGAALYGPIAGGWLGLVFAAAVFVTNDAALFLQFNIPGTIITVILKSVLAGVAAGFAYKLIAKKNKLVAIIVASVVAPVVNTLIFFLGSLVFFFDSIKEFWGIGSSGAVVKFVIIGLIGINFIIELVSSILLAPTAHRIININKK